MRKALKKRKKRMSKEEKGEREREKRERDEEEMKLLLRGSFFRIRRTTVRMGSFRSAFLNEESCGY